MHGIHSPECHSQVVNRFRFISHRGDPSCESAQIRRVDERSLVKSDAKPTLHDLSTLGWERSSGSGIIYPGIPSVSEEMKSSAGIARHQIA